MKTFDRYLIKELVVPFLFGVAAFSGILFATDQLFRLLKLLAEMHYPGVVVGKIFLLRLPSIIVVTLPMSVLLAALLAMTRLSSESETAAMYAGGVSLYRALWPLLGFALFISAVTFFLNETVVPKANEEARRVLESGRGGGQAKRDVLLRHPNEGPPERIAFAREFVPATKLLRSVDLLIYLDGEPRTYIRCEEAVWIEDEWDFRDGFMESLGTPESWQEGGNPSISGRVGKVIIPFEHVRVNLGKSPEDIQRVHKEPEEMTALELSRRLEELRAIPRGLERTLRRFQLKVHLHGRFAIPLACLVFCLLGVPLGMRRQRTSSSAGFGISVILVFIYYIILRYGTILAENGELQPVLAAWLPNAVAVVIGVVLLLRSPK